MPRLSRAAILALLLANWSTAFGEAAFECPRVDVQPIATLPENDNQYSRHVSIRFRADGRPLLLYAAGAVNEQELHLVDCLDERCTNFVDRQIDATYNYVDPPGFDIGPDGRPVILTNWYGRLYYYDCGDSTCSFYRKRQMEVDPTGSVFAATVRSDGRPVLVYSHWRWQTDPFDVFVYICSDRRCESGTKQRVVDVDPASDGYVFRPAAALDSADRLHLTYLQSDGASANALYKLLRCADIDCTTSVSRLVSGPTFLSYPERTSLAIRSDDRAVMVDGQIGRNVLIGCGDAECSEWQPTTVPSPSGLTLTDADALATDLPILSALSATSAGFFVCLDNECSSGVALAADATSPTTLSSELAVSPTGRPMLAFYSTMGESLQLATCAPNEIWSNSFE